MKLDQCVHVHIGKEMIIILLFIRIKNGQVASSLAGCDFFFIHFYLNTKQVYLFLSAIPAQLFLQHS
jgi:hypothetical protein